jgi:acetolactate synthase-1/2/3 large subunit
VKIKLSDFVAGYLKNIGIKHIFTVVGGGAMHLNDSFRKESSIKSIFNHHEQASAIASESYARLKGKLAVCVVTTGPGAVNALTGLIGAWQDSIPVLFISGQVNTDISLYQYPSIRQFGLQEVNILAMVKSATKFAEAVLEPNKIKYQLGKAIFMATSGRPGPVWLDIPLNIQSTIIDTNNLSDFSSAEIKATTTNNKLPIQVSKIIELLKKSKRPVIIAGHGIRLSHSLPEFYSFIKKIKIPVLTSMGGLDLLWETHPLYVGRFGLYGNRGGNFTVQNADLLLIIGSRLHPQQTGWNKNLFSRESYKIMVDIDRNEIFKPLLKINFPLISDVKQFLNEFNQQVTTSTFSKQKNTFKKWLDKTKFWQKRYPSILPEYSRQKKLVNFYYFIGILSDLLGRNDIVVTGNGTSFTGTFQSFKVKPGQRICANIGCASMGYDLPAAIGASFANPKKKIHLITGDGSIQMNLQELQTVVYHQLPIKIFLLNNNGYMAIRTTQMNYFKDFYGTDSKHGIGFPNIQKIAKAYGIPSIKITNQKNLSQKIKKILNQSGPTICEILMPENQQLIPKLTAVMKPDGTFLNKPLEDMYPFLDRKEFFENMLVKPINPEI